jgi:hypothetical protein
MLVVSDDGDWPGHATAVVTGATVKYQDPVFINIATRCNLSECDACSDEVVRLLMSDEDIGSSC